LIEAIGLGLYFKTYTINANKISWFVGIGGRMKTYFYFGEFNYL
jgi:hypothetical protein